MFCLFQLEKSPTLGSLETNDFEKRTLALKSIEFNLKDKDVLDLFPDEVEVCCFIINIFNCETKLFI